jgi:integrase
VKAKDACNNLSNSVAPARRETDAMPRRAHATEFSLYSTNGARKYLNRDERQRVLSEMVKFPPDQALFCLTLAWTGARISEVLALTSSSFQIGAGVVAFRTLKRRKHHVREVPIPPDLMTALNRHFGLSAMDKPVRAADSRLWPWHRTTAWRIIKRVMARSTIAGRHASPRGLRHAFGVNSLAAGMPLNLVQRMLGHSSIATTSIYTQAVGPEERALVARFWNFTG